MIQNSKRMIIQRQNKRGDFVFRLAFKEQNGNTVEPPHRLSIKLTTDEEAGSFVAEYKDDGDCTRCKRVPEGIDIFVSLSRQYIGAGRMILETVSYLQDERFDGGEKRIASKSYTSVVLWDGASDNDSIITGTIIL